MSNIYNVKHTLIHLSTFLAIKIEITIFFYLNKQKINNFRHGHAFWKKYYNLIHMLNGRFMIRRQIEIKGLLNFLINLFYH